METNRDLKFPSLIIGMALGAVAGLLLAPRRGEETRKFLRERSNKGLDQLNAQAAKLRAAAESLVETGRKLMACQHQPANTATEAEEQVDQEKRRDTLGG